MNSDGSGTNRVGVVAIGRNEGERLRRCLESIKGSTRAAVYVDSSSTDGSVELARGLGVEVVELDMSKPFSAARARNAGFERLREIAPDLDFVQFVDGDCEVAPRWLETAARVLTERPDVAVVCGRRRERYPDRSIYNELCDIEWDAPIGEVGACGGDAMMRIEAFVKAGGYDPALVAGEEPELCFRLRGMGFRVVRLPSEMTLHDAAMLKFSQWWKRTVRSGHAAAEMAFMHGREEGRPGVRSTASNFLWALVVPSVVVATRPLVGPLAAAVYPLQACRIYQQQLEIGRSYRQAGIYALACTVGKFPETVGALRFLAGVATGKRSKIIEYK